MFSGSESLSLVYLGLAGFIVSPLNVYRSEISTSKQCFLMVPHRLRTIFCHFVGSV